MRSKAEDAARKRAERARNTAWVRERDRVQKRAYRLANGSGRVARSFVGVDGEGGTVNGRHEYLLLRAGDRTLQTGHPLSTHECLTFLADLSPGPIYVGYFFDYDSTMILRGMPWDRVKRIFERDERTFDRSVPLAVDYGDFQVDYLPGKELKVRRRTDDKLGRWVTVSDVGSFFQCSFVKALSDWNIGTVEQRAAIAEGKALRHDFTNLTAETDEYNRLEIRLLEQLMGAFRDVCRDTGYMPAKFQGPGYLASRMLGAHGVPKTRDLDLPDKVVIAAQRAFYGGRFETSAVGRIPGPIFQYDINSAYPWALTRLPCLVHGRWKSTREPEPGSLYLAHKRFQPKDRDVHWYGLPIRRKNGSIHCPANGSGWYWSVELEAAIHQTVEGREYAYQYMQECDCKPFDWIPEVYMERIKLGKAAKGKVLKLALNSLYGKTCQSIGKPPYANPIYASLITAMVRAKLGSIMHAGPDCCSDVYMLATDGVFSGRRNIEQTAELGGWDAVEHPGMFIVQPGVYFLDGQESPKTRGIPQSVIVAREDDFRAAWERSSIEREIPLIQVDLTQFISLKLAFSRNAMRTAGNWAKVTRDISFEWTTKRSPKTRTLDGIVRTYPYQKGQESVPYSRDIGRMLDRMVGRDELLHQPDWADTLTEA